MLSALVVAAAVLVAAGVVAAALASRPRRALAGRVRRTVVVHRFELPSLRGVLAEQHADALVLRRAVVLLEPDRRGEDPPAPMPLDGDVVVPLAVVESVQVLDVPALRLGPRAVPRRSADSGSSATPWAAAPPDPRPLRRVG